MADEQRLLVKPPDPVGEGWTLQPRLERLLHGQRHWDDGEVGHVYCPEHLSAAFARLTTSARDAAVARPTVCSRWRLSFVLPENVVAIFNTMLERPGKSWYGLEIAKHAGIGSATNLFRPDEAGARWHA